MSEAQGVTVCKAILSHIEAQVAEGAFQTPFELRRSYAGWDFQLKKDGPVYVDVVFIGETPTMATRGGEHKYATTVDVIVRQKLQGPTDTEGWHANETIDPLLLLSEQLHKALVPQRIGADLGTTADEDPKPLAPIRSHLGSMRQFTLPIRLTLQRFD